MSQKLFWGAPGPPSKINPEKLPQQNPLGKFESFHLEAIWPTMDTTRDFFSKNFDLWAEGFSLDSGTLQPVLGSIKENGHSQSHDCSLGGRYCTVLAQIFHFDAHATMSSWKHALLPRPVFGGTCLSNEHDVQNREINFPNVQPAQEPHPNLDLEGLKLKRIRPVDFFGWNKRKTHHRQRWREKRHHTDVCWFF